MTGETDKMRYLFLFCMVWNFLLACHAEDGKSVDFRNYKLDRSSRARETMEWTTFFATNLSDKSKPRVLFIGDSICRDYQSVVAKELRGLANCTQWTTSRCVTDPLYLQELDVFLSFAPHAVICFNNGLHSQFTDLREYREAYRKAVAYLKARCPESRIFIVLCTPVQSEYYNSVVLRVNQIAKKIAEEQQLPVIDVYTFLNRGECAGKWRDGVHFNGEANRALGRKIAETIKSAVPEKQKTEKKG